MKNKRVYVVSLAVQTNDRKQAKALKQQIDRLLKKYTSLHRLTVAPPLEAEIEEWE